MLYLGWKAALAGPNLSYPLERYIQPQPHCAAAAMYLAGKVHDVDLNLGELDKKFNSQKDVSLLQIQHELAELKIASKGAKASYDELSTLNGIFIFHLVLPGNEGHFSCGRWNKEKGCVELYDTVLQKQDFKKEEFAPLWSGSFLWITGRQS